MAELAYIQVTRTCNQKCRFCSNPPTGKTVPLEYMKNLVDSYINQGYEGLILSGGEPTLYPYLAKVIHYSAQKKLPVRIITNGQNTSNFKYLKSLVDAGLNQINCSIYSDNQDIQSFLTENDESLSNIKKTLAHIGKLNVAVNMITVINKYNADHLSRIVMWLVKEYSFIRHFIWNNIDPTMNRASENPDTIPRLADFELELNRAMHFLAEQKRTFRVERVPLCYMVDFAHCSTEARKIIKREKRAIYFLDEKGLKIQKGWSYGKAECCNVCFLNEICPGLYSMDKQFHSAELYPVFVSKEEIIKHVKSEP